MLFQSSADFDSISGGLQILIALDQMLHDRPTLVI